MDCTWRRARLGRVLAAALLLAVGQQQAGAQLVRAGDAAGFQLADTVHVNRADSGVLADLERVKAHLGAGQWDEAVETLRRLLETSEEKLIAVSQRRWVGLRDYCHLQVAGLPPEALALYRSRVDPVARAWYEEGMAKRDRALLGKVVDEAFASSWGDDALMALGELALEEGDYASARWYWERIIPARIAAEAARSWPGFPDTDLDLAAVRARLVLVSILEGSAQRAAEELSQLARLHPEARGWLGGREVNYVEALGGLLAESAAWPRPQPSPDWPTFAGSPARNKVAADLVDVGTVDWRMPLRPVRAAGPGDAPPSAKLSYHPVYADGLLLLGDSLEIRAVEAATGQAAWGGSGWTIYRDQLMGVLGESIHQVRDSALGVPRHTMTEFGGRLYARMGSPATGPGEAIAADVAGSGTMPGYLVCLDLAAEGRLVWKIAPEEGWAFEGSPVVDGANVYVGVRRGMVPEADVACFDAETGRLRWRVFVCSAETPGRGTLVEYAHNLLTLQGRTLYYNTNLGAVAAISAQDGRIRWVSLYPRATEGRLPDLAPHWRRDLNPCLYDHGTLLVAPADSPRIFALDAGTGQILWQTGEEVQGALDLLGTTEEYLIAGGDRLYWIAMAGDDRGRVKYVWPQSDERPGFGRGVLSGQSVLWPTREKLYVFDQHTARLKKAFDLDARGASGGNLLVADGRLVIATATELIALGQYGGAVSEEPGETKIGQPAGQPLDPQLSTLNQPH